MERGSDDHGSEFEVMSLLIAVEVKNEKGNRGVRGSWYRAEAQAADLTIRSVAVPANVASDTMKYEK